MCDYQIKGRFIFHCQPDWIYNHHRNTPLGVCESVSKKASLRIVGSPFEQLSAGLNKNVKVSWVPECISLCFLTTDMVQPAVSCSCYHAFLIMIGYTSLNCKPKQTLPFFFQKYFLCMGVLPACMPMNHFDAWCP